MRYINGFSEKQIADSKRKTRTIADGYELPICTRLESMPPHLVDKDHDKTPVPANGTEFAKAGVWYYDPVTGEPFEANGFGYFEGFALMVRERPGHGLVACEPNSDLKPGDLLSFLKAMWEKNRFWSSLVCREFKRRGVRISGKLDEIDPADIHIYAVENFGRKVRDEVREFLEKLLEDPEWLIEENEKQHISELRNWCRNIRQKELDRRKEIGKMTVTEELTARWSAINKTAKEGGLASGKVQELFARVCSDLKMEVGLAPESLDALENAVNQELGLVEAQTKSAAKSKEVQEKADTALKEVFGEEQKPFEVPLAFKEMYKSAKKHGVSQEQVEAWQKEFAVGDDLYSLAVLDQINIKIASILAGDLAEVSAEDLPTGEAVAESFEVQDETPPVPASAPATETEPESGTKKGRKRAEKVQGQSSLERVHITNRSNGEVKTLNEVMKQRFELIADLEAINNRIKMYADQQEAKIREIEISLSGWDFCYKANVVEVVRDQFARNRKPDGSFKPATIKTEWATFKRNAQAEAICIDEAKFQAWAQELPEEERGLWGDVIQVTVKGSKTAAKKEVAGGLPIPGWMKVDEPDDIGEPKFDLSKPRDTVDEQIEETEEPQQEIAA